MVERTGYGIDTVAASLLARRVIPVSTEIMIVQALPSAIERVVGCPSEQWIPDDAHRHTHQHAWKAKRASDTKPLRSASSPTL
ncbi:MAG: hypothetical protein DMF84_12560 [Acidobacteria bacterium]|nr:MAG: hypothetical protein DMF84_12560 [Acidobacteriota bacterium]